MSTKSRVLRIAVPFQPHEVLLPGVRKRAVSKRVVLEDVSRAELKVTHLR